MPLTVEDFQYRHMPRGLRPLPQASKPATNGHAAPAKQTICERDGFHRFFVCEKLLTVLDEKNILHIFGACTSCGTPLHHEYEVGGNVIYVGSETPREEHE